MQTKIFIKLDTSIEEFFNILEIAKNLKNKDLNIEIKDKVLGLIFDKSSTRTRVSFQVAMSNGGHTIDLVNHLPNWEG